jgi:single-strand DNA-binding protein
VIVTGPAAQRSYETREGEKRTVMELEVDEIGPSLRYATAKVQKMSRSSGSGGGFGPAAATGGGGGNFDDPWASAVRPAGPRGSGSSFDEEPPF